VTDEPAQTVVQADPHRDPAPVADHAFSPRGEWWSLCRVCSLAEAAHIEKTESQSQLTCGCDPMGEGLDHHGWCGRHPRWLNEGHEA
jgi:hypothetical protein